jgi:NAD(P)-dependent dehydrogenase (short-subunit alcohol dehydrogenase family)
MAREHKVWFITGAGRGFGRVWAVAALERGDRVTAAVRDISKVADLIETYGDAVLAVQLDVNDRRAAEPAVCQAVEHFGRLDIVVNNAGYGQFGALEEVTEQEFRAQFETNVFGALWVTQAVIPVLRAQGSGHILQVSSIAGLTAYPNTGTYHASKFALEGLTESLAQEIAPFGIKVTLIEPGAYSTDYSGSSAHHADQLPCYDQMRADLPDGGVGQGDPEATGQAILAVVDAQDPPLRILLGEPPTHVVKAVYAEKLATWERWGHISRQAQAV